MWGMNVFCVHLRSLALSVPARTERRSPTHDFHRPLNTDLRRLFTGPASATNFWTDSSSLITVPSVHVPFIIQANFVPISVMILATTRTAHNLISDLHTAFIGLQRRSTFCGGTITSCPHAHFDILSPFLQIGRP